MSVSIKHHYHYGNVYINENGVICGKALTGNTIPALRTNGDLRYLPFGGVIDDEFAKACEQYRPVKLLNISAFWWNDLGMGEDGYEIPLDHITKGYYFNDRYYLAILNDVPIHWQSDKVHARTNYHTNNVFYLPPTEGN
ncbi:TPA: hypothetical protein ACGUO9_004191 [Vibrio vulnificus]